MDVRFTNVLEGARQYFQGLPTGTNSMVSHAYPSEGHRQQNELEQGREPPPGPDSYWPQQASEPGQKATSQPSHSTGPPSHPQYAQNVQNEQSRHHYPTGSFNEQYQLSQQQQNFQFPRPHSREIAPSNAQYQSHIPSSSTYQQAPSPTVRSQSTSVQYQVMSPSYQVNQASVVKTPPMSSQYQSHIPKSSVYTQPHSPTIKPPASSQYQSTSSAYLQPHSPTVKPPPNLPQYPYNRPHSPTVKPPPSTQYQLQVPSSSPYHQPPSPFHQPPSPYHQTPSPQLPRVPSREQLTPRVPSREQPLSRAPSQEQLGPQNSLYPQVSEGYSNYSQSRSYYPIQQQAKTVPNNSYKAVPSSQPYPVASQQNEAYYYKHIYSKQAQPQQQVAYGNSRSNFDHNSEQGFRTTHNLPPIAAISNYHSSRSAREPSRTANTTSTRTRTFNSNSHTSTSQSVATTSSTSSIIQQTPNHTPYTQTMAISNYQDYRTSTNQPQPHYQYIVTTTTTTQSYGQVVVTSSSNTPSYYAAANQNQSSIQQFYQQQNKSNVPRISSAVNQQSVAQSNVTVPKKESPLDLSVKTVRTPADSTFGDADNEARNKLYQTSRSSHPSLSSHSYPQLDVGSIHRNFSQRAGQLSSATAPKVEFRPNFNVPSLAQPRPPPPRTLVEEPRKNLVPEKAHSNSRSLYEPNIYQNVNTTRYTSVTVPSSAHVNSFIQTQSIPQNPTMSGSGRVPVPNYKSSMYTVPMQDTQKKRPADVAPTVVPPKQSKLDNWRQSIDLQIEERLSSYQQQQAKASTTNRPSTMNGAYANQERTKDMYASYQKPSYENLTKQPSFNMQSPYQAPSSHSQTYVPSPATHQYPSYTGFPPQTSQPNNSYMPPSRSNSTTLNISKNSPGGAVDKRTISILKNTIEVKGRKKLEQQKTHELYMQHPRSDIQHPSTDVTAPLQPKPGLIGRNNISPFTPTSFPDNTNMYKFHLPKAIDSINFDTNKSSNLSLEKQSQSQSHDTVITNHSSHNPEIDGLAAFLAARIRTKGERKQVAATTQNVSNNNTANECHQQGILESQMKSPVRQEYISQTSSSSGTVIASPPKILKDRQAFAPRKRLFSRNEEDPSNSSLPSRDKSGLRSSSETSVFDFPDSDSENDIIGRESLEAMRKGRRSSKQSSTPLIDVKPESPARAVPLEDDIFAQLCDNFVEQLKSTSSTEKIKKIKCVEVDALANLEIITSEEPLEAEIIAVKEEVEDLVKCDDIIAEEMKEIDAQEEIPKVVEIKEEPEDHSFPEESKSIADDSDLKAKIEKEQESKSDFIDKEDDPVFISKQENVRRRLISSSDTGDETKEKRVEDQVEPQSKEPRIISDTAVLKDDVKSNENKLTESPTKPAELPPFIRPAKKPSFGDGSDFYPGWEEGVYKYKKALRMPPSLIQVSRPPQFHRLSTSLPDLDPYPQSPTTSISIETDRESGSSKSKIKKMKSDCMDSDNESNSSFNLFGRKTNYDSEGSASVKSLPNTAKEMSILDKLLEKCGGKKKRKYKRKDDHSPKIIPKVENPMELMPTPSLEIKEEEKDKEIKKLSSSPVIKSESALLGFSKRTINNFKDAFIKKQNNILGVNEQFTTVVFKSRTRKETRVLKQRATIKEVFGEDRPASAPPVTCVNDLQQIKEEVLDDNNRLGKLVVKLEKQDVVIDKVIESQKEMLVNKENDHENTKHDLKNKLLIKSKKQENNLLNTLDEKKIKTDPQDEIEDDTRSLEEVVIKRDPDEKSETPSVDGDEGSVSGRRRTKFGKIRRKLSSGFDYIRKKKKVKKDINEIDSAEKKKRKCVVTKAPESIDDIQKEIKSWVLNKGIGETHLHRAARLGYTDVMAYCLENLQSNPSPKDNAGYTPLHVACTRGHLEIAKLLLLYGANASESALGGIRPLHEAAENGFVEVTRLLLSYGADPTLATYSGITPLALTNDEATKQFLRNHLNDIEGELSEPWEISYGPATSFDPVDKIGYNVFDDAPEADPKSEDEDLDLEVTEQLLPNLYTLRGEPPTDRWVLLQDLSTILKIKSRDALLRQICPPSTSGPTVNHKTVLRELKMTDFLEQAHCCQFLNAGEKINTRASKIALVRYSDKVKELLGVENVRIEVR